jgi:cyclic pyranopterin phosphate synthase
LSPRPEISLSANGSGLARTAAALADAGLDRVNVGLDTARLETFAEITRRRKFDEVVAGCEAALAVGFAPVRITAVPLRVSTMTTRPSVGVVS